MIDKPTTTEQATDMAWTLANAMTNVVTPALRARDQLIRDLIRDAERTGDNDLGGMLDAHQARARALGVLPAIETDDDDSECEGHESTAGPIGNVVFCDGSCQA